MATPKAYNKNNAGVKRILREAAELANDPSPDFTAHPLDHDLFDWHCTMRGPPGTEFEGGLYHFRIVLPAEYPFRPPSIILLTPNGRFECGTKICISFTNYHEELWQPAWGVRTAIVALQGFFPLKGQAAIGVGAVEYPESERRRLSILSRDWTCPECQCSNKELLAPQTGEQTEATSSSGEVEKAESPNQPEPVPQEDPPIQEPTLPDPLPQVQPQPSQTSNPPSNSSTEPVVMHHVEGIQGNRMIVTQAQASRPPMLLDAAIATLLVLAGALLIRKIL